MSSLPLCRLNKQRISLSFRWVCLTDDSETLDSLKTERWIISIFWNHGAISPARSILPSPSSVLLAEMIPVSVIRTACSFSLIAEAPSDVLFWPLQTTQLCIPWRSRFVCTFWVSSGTCSRSLRLWTPRTACICTILLGILRNIASPARCRSSTACFSPSCPRLPRSRSPSSKSAIAGDDRA